MLHCPFCEREVTGLTSYGVAGAFRLFVCNACYVRLVRSEHQPHSKPMQRLRRLLWGSPRKKEVMTDAGLTESGTTRHVHHGMADESTQTPTVSVAESASRRVIRAAHTGGMTR